MRTLVNLTPAPEFRALDEMFERFLGGSSPNAPTVNSLPIDITERDNILTISAAVPGVSPEALEIHIDKNVLTIRSETKAEASQGDERIYRREISYGAFSRSVRLPENLNLEKVDAEFKNGMVAIVIPRVVVEKPEPRRIAVRVAEPVLAPNENE